MGKNKRKLLDWSTHKAINLFAILFFGVIIVGLFYFRPQLTGLVTLEETEVVTIDQTFNTDSEIPLDFEADIISIRCQRMNLLFCISVASCCYRTM